MILHGPSFRFVEGLQPLVVMPAFIPLSAPAGPKKGSIFPWLTTHRLRTAFDHGRESRAEEAEAVTQTARSPASRESGEPSGGGEGHERRWQALADDAISSASACGRTHVGARSFCGKASARRKASSRS